MFHPIQRFQEKRPEIREKSRRGAGHVIFSRGLLVALLVAAQVLLLVGLFTRWQFAAFAYGGTYALSIFMAFYLINRPMNPTTRQTWLILVLLAPVLGSLLYVFVETDIGHRLVRRRLADIARSTRDSLPRPDDVMARLRTEDPSLHSLAVYTDSHGGFPIYDNTSVRYFPEGADMYASLLEELEKAEDFIFMEFFIINEGEVWDSVLDVLRRKAKQGVDVRLLYDGTCAIFRLPYHYPQKLEEMGIACKMFSPIRPLVSTYYNNRDHRKIVVVDGRTAFTGGVNLADEYVNRIERFGHWKDTGVMLRGDAVRSFTLMFLQMWQVTEPALEFKRYLEAPMERQPDAKGYVLPYGDSPFDNERVGESVYLDIINRASRYVYIMTPYLIIDGEMTTALTFAAKRGVDVRIILPHIPDKKVAFALAYTHYRELIRAGVSIYEYTPGFVHAKVFLSDDSKAVVGSINLDYRSLYLHFECAAYLKDVPAIDDIRRDMLDTLAQSQQVTEESLARVPWTRKAMGFLLKLFAPLM